MRTNILPGAAVLKYHATSCLVEGYSPAIIRNLMKSRTLMVYKLINVCLRGFMFAFLKQNDVRWV